MKISDLPILRDFNKAGYYYRKSESRESGFYFYIPNPEFPLGYCWKCQVEYRSRFNTVHVNYKLQLYGEI